MGSAMVVSLRGARGLAHGKAPTGNCLPRRRVSLFDPSRWSRAAPLKTFETKMTEPDTRETAKPRFWGPASWWRLGLVALAVLMVALWIGQS